MSWSRIAGVVVGFLAAAVLAVIVLFLGPNEQVVCGGGHLANQIAQDVSQGIGNEGANATYCVVPAPVTWTIAAVLCGGGIVAGFFIGRQQR